MRNEFGLLELIVDHLPLAVFAKDPQDDFRYVLWNQTAVDLWQHPKDLVLGKNDFECFAAPAAESFRRVDLQTLQKKEVLFVERQVVETAKNGKLWIRIWKYPVFDADGKAVLLLGVAQDITELVLNENKRRQNDQMLHLQTEKLAHASRLAALGEMAGGVAHEINTPLGVISLHSEVAQAMLDQGPESCEAVRTHLEKIQETAFRIAKIVQTMKSVTRSATDDTAEWVSFPAMLEDLRTLAAHRLKHEMVELKTDRVPEDLQLHCRGVQLGQVFLNLLNNAIDAIRERDPRWVCIEVRDAGAEWIEILFSDCGPGIEPEIRSQMFESFFTTKASQNGTGLGLSISRDILHAHGGEISFDSSAPNTTFVLRWPKSRINRSQTVPDWSFRSAEFENHAH